jgi:hypothetical protein
MLPAGIFLKTNGPCELCVSVSVEVSRHRSFILYPHVYPMSIRIQRRHPDMNPPHMHSDMLWHAATSSHVPSGAIPEAEWSL